MPQLNSRQLQLRQLERQRGLANALQQSALSFQPIEHPLQGVAKLAQALVSNQINRRTDDKQEKLEKERREGIAAALSSTTPPNVFGTGGQPRSTEDMIQDLARVDPDMALRLQSEPLQRRMMLEQNTLFAPQQQRAPQSDFSRVGQRVVSGLSDTPREMEVNQEKLSGRLFVNDENGNRTFLSSDQVTTPTERTTNVPFSTNERNELIGTFAQAGVAFDQFTRLREGINKGALSDQTAVGAARSIVENTVSSVRALGQTGEALIRGRLSNDEGQLGQRRNFSGYGANNVSAEDRLKYSGDDIAANLSAWERLQQADAGYQQVAISIAYSLARIADPGGRLSEMDVLNQMRGLQLDSSSKPKRRSALDNAERTFAVNLKQQLQLRSAIGQDFPVPEELMRRIDGVLERTNPVITISPNDARNFIGQQGVSYEETPDGLFVIAPDGTRYKVQQ
ncbi:MAG: hypothetical protein KTR33_13860 [Gammaproteobacteria bacterium]|nr:hypothetical protein [Gammaproteobacteria bacterium]